MRFTSITLAFIVCLSVFVGCKTIDEVGVKLKFPSNDTGKVKHKGKGPPPHAPAHGYRHKHQDGIELEYDSGLGVYFSVKMPSVYFCNGLYMRLSDGHWEVAGNFGGPWRLEVEGQVPHKLKKAKGKKHRGQKKGRGKKKK
jgi:hypothetical protein